jgi:hypothetical protein
MNWEYLSGFFDADGSITISVLSKGKNKTPILSFHNNEISILEEIKEFILNELNIKGFITHKKSKKETHNDSYSLNYKYFPKVIEIMSKFNIKHPKKRHRYEIILKIYELTKRNGKYSEVELKKKLDMEKLFWLH